MKRFCLRKSHLRGIVTIPETSELELSSFPSHFQQVDGLWSSKRQTVGRHLVLSRMTSWPSTFAFIGAAIFNVVVIILIIVKYVNDGA